MKLEHSNKCDKCKLKGGALFSRIFFNKINGKWVWLCKSCWDLQLKKR